MGLGLTSGVISQRSPFGFVVDEDRYFTRTSDTDFDNAFKKAQELEMVPGVLSRIPLIRR